MYNTSIDVRKRLFGSVILLMMAVVFTATTAFATSDESLSSAGMITKAYDSGEVDMQTYAIQKLRAYFDPDTVAPAFRSKIVGPIQPSREQTILFHIVTEYYDSYNEKDRIFIDSVKARPTGLDSSHPTTNFRFHYTTTGTDAVSATDTDANGVPDYVDTMATVFEYVYTQETSTLGYDKPPKDPGGDNYGGDDKFDVYIRDEGADGNYGSEIPEGIAGGGDGNELYSHMRMDNDYAGFPDTPENNTKVTAAHEFHHAIQDGYNGTFYGTSPWIYESTSTWIEDQVYDSIDDNLRYINGTGPDAFFYNPERSLDSYQGYGVWIWQEFLETKFDQATVRKVWEQLDPVGENAPLVATETVLTNKSSTLKDAFTLFAAKNYSQTGFYKDAEKYDPVYIVNESNPHEIDPINSSVDWKTINVDHLAAKYYKFVPGSSLTTSSLLSIEVNGVDNKDVNAIAVVKDRSGSYKEYSFSLDAVTKEGKVDISGFSYNDISEIILALVNYSKTDDDLEIKYKAQITVLPVPDIKANGSDGPIDINTGDNLSVTLELDSGGQTGSDADWWVAESTPDGWYYYSLTTSWTFAGSSYTGLSPTYQGALFDLGSYSVLNTSGLSEGTHTFYFAIDTNMNGTLDLDQIYFDSVEVNVTQ